MCINKHLSSTTESRLVFAMKSLAPEELSGPETPEQYEARHAEKLREDAGRILDRYRDISRYGRNADSARSVARVTAASGLLYGTYSLVTGGAGGILVGAASVLGAGELMVNPWRKVEVEKMLEDEELKATLVSDQSVVYGRPFWRALGLRSNIEVTTKEYDTINERLSRVRELREAVRAERIQKLKEREALRSALAFTTWGKMKQELWYPVKDLVGGDERAQNKGYESLLRDIDRVEKKYGEKKITLEEKLNEARQQHARKVEGAEQSFKEIQEKFLAIIQAYKVEATPEQMAALLRGDTLSQAITVNGKACDNIREVLAALPNTDFIDDYFLRREVKKAQKVDMKKKRIDGRYRANNFGEFSENGMQKRNAERREESRVETLVQNGEKIADEFWAIVQRVCIVSVDVKNHKEVRDFLRDVGKMTVLSDTRNTTTLVRLGGLSREKMEKEVEKLRAISAKLPDGNAKKAELSAVATLVEETIKAHENIKSRLTKECQDPKELLKWNPPFILELRLRDFDVPGRKEIMARYTGLRKIEEIRTKSFAGITTPTDLATAIETAGTKKRSPEWENIMTLYAIHCATAPAKSQLASILANTARRPELNEAQVNTYKALGVTPRDTDTAVTLAHSLLDKLNIRDSKDYYKNPVKTAEALAAAEKILGIK